MMYEELIEQLRSRASWLEFAIIKTPSKTDGNGDAILFRKAADAIEDLITALTASNEVIAKNKPQWIPVTERLPDESFKNVLCCGARGGMFVGWVATKPEDGKIMAFVHGGNGRYITHWMPLPEPPKDGEA